MATLVIVDVQNDFLPGGNLAVPDGDQVIEPILRLAEHADRIYVSRDWHPANHASFLLNGGPWPTHCVVGTPGAELHPAIAEIDATVIDKATASDIDEYSAARYILVEPGEEVLVCGLALDYCVKETAIGLHAAGARVVVPIETTRPVAYVTGATTIAGLLQHGVFVANLPG